MSDPKPIDHFLDTVQRGIQALLIAHGAALLALVTTYVTPSEAVPPVIRPFLRMFAIGFLLAAWAAFTLPYMVEYRNRADLGDRAAAGWANLFEWVVIFSALGSFGLVFFAVIRVLFLP